MPSWRSDSAIKLITYSEELVDGKPLYAFSNSRPVKALNREPAGHAFHSAALKLLGCAAKPRYAKGSDKKVGDDDDKDEEYVNPSFNPFANKSKKKKKMRPAVTQQQQEDHYALLGLKSLRYLATEDQIKKGYREAALKHHPDKLVKLVLAEETEEAKEAKKDEIESRFRAIQEAYEVLMDPTKRKIFDSTDEFNDVEEDLSPREFFKVFGSAFKRTARFSAASCQRVPDLGDENTNPKDVDIFYSFWFGFKSLRKFTDQERHDPEKASSRQERRWMERENAKNKEKAKKEENVRIQTLVENAYRMDPRIAKRKEDKERKKEAKRMAEEKREEEAAEKEKRRKEEAAKAKEKERNLLRKERNRFRTLSAHVLAQRLVSKEDVENLCMSLNFEQLQNLNDTLGNKQGVELANVIKEHEANSSKEKESEKAEPTKLDNTQEKKENEKAEPTKLDNTEKKKQEQWSKEEIDKLKKGIVKYPKGTSRRWEVISDYIGTGRSVEEILKATKSVILQKPDSAKAFDSFLEKRKPTGPIASPLSTREELGESLPMANNGEASGSSDTDGWSSVEERALVQALKTFPKETSQRWERVAAAIPGKTVVQCKKKFTELKEFIRSKKSGVV
ncbi:unnamed protein product [Eruca vesicaria subsp. sativa]|uniref:Uncharacterized protein n=1 Tax=Eruca vesicaria subsp. sativa TaxID=29727 RepID=A0ABC8JDH8_ERUVS|nr:unnamed protein product [Eruca vesicaria subsp. sativa]